MRIALITFHDPINYGAVLQCYALCQVLRDLGHEVAVIDYHRPLPPSKVGDRALWARVPREARRRLKLLIANYKTRTI